MGLLKSPMNYLSSFIFTLCFTFEGNGIPLSVSDGESKGWEPIAAVQVGHDERGRDRLSWSEQQQPGRAGLIMTSPPVSKHHFSAPCMGSHFLLSNLLCLFLRRTIMIILRDHRGESSNQPGIKDPQHSQSLCQHRSQHRLQKLNFCHGVTAIFATVIIRVFFKSENKILFTVIIKHIC